MTTIGKGTRVVCVRDEWIDEIPKPCDGPSIGSQHVVAMAADCLTNGIWLALHGWSGFFLSDHFRPVDQIDDMAEAARGAKNPDNVDEGYLEVVR